jgi:hypothetical protein
VESVHNIQDKHKFRAAVRARSIYPFRIYLTRNISMSASTYTGIPGET